MQFRTDASGVDELWDFLRQYYEKKNRGIKFLSSGSVGHYDDEGDHYFVTFLLDRKHVLKYSMPTAIRTSSILWVGIGPEYVPIQWTLGAESSMRFSGDRSSDAVEKNLVLLDEYLAGGLV